MMRAGRRYPAATGPTSLAGEASPPFRATVALTYLAVVLTLLVPPPLLTVLGVPYDAPYGSFVFKIHPGTYALLAALALALLGHGNPLRALARALARRPAVAAYVLGVVLAMAYATARHGPSGVAFFVDSLLAPGLMVLLLAELGPAHRRRLFWFVAALLVVNCGIGIAEQLLRARLIPLTVAGGVALIEDVFRATALMGHPLANAAVTGFALLTFYGLKDPAARTAMCLLTLVALLSFGGRAAFAINAGLLALLVAWDALGALRRRGIGYRTLSGGGALVVLLAAFLVAAVAYVGVGERILAKLAWDDSAAVRQTGLDVYDHVRWEGLLFGHGPDEIEQLIRRVGFTAEVPTLENFWVVITLQLGWVFALPFLVGFAAFMLHLWRLSAAPVRFALLGFVLVVSTSNSLSAKTAIFTNVVVLAVTAAAWRARTPVLKERPLPFAARKA